MPHSISGQRTQAGSLAVALLDGVPLFRDGMSALIHRTAGLRWVGATDNRTAALQLCERFRPDVLVVDSSLDARLQLTEVLVAGEPKLSVLTLIAPPQRTNRHVTAALAAGTHGVLLRSTEAGQLIEAIRMVHAERRYVDPALAPLLTAPRIRAVHPGQQPLSRREYQVLQLIAEGLENQAVAKILFVSVETVRTHVKSILRKLAARDRTHAVAMAFRAGVLTAEDSPWPGTTRYANGE